MNMQARIARIEKSVQGRLNINPNSVKAILSFFESGDLAEIPEGITFKEVQAAGSKIQRKDVARLPGLCRLREALGDYCRGDVLEHIAAEGSSFVILNRTIEESRDPKTKDPAAELLERLGFQVLAISYDFLPVVRPQGGQDAQS